MDIRPGHVLSSGLLVFLSGESSQSFMVDIEPEGVSACEEDVDAEVELELVDEKRVFNITLDDVFVSVEDVLDVPG